MVNQYLIQYDENLFELLLTNILLNTLSLTKKDTIYNLQIIEKPEYI